jgi:hypothetical protein
MSFMAAWLGVRAPVDVESCHTGTVARAVSTVDQVGGDWQAEIPNGAEHGRAVRDGEVNAEEKSDFASTWCSTG